MAKAKRKKPEKGTCLHALRKNKKEIAALFREAVLGVMMSWDKSAEIERIVGEVDLAELIDDWAAGCDTAEQVETIPTDEIIDRIEECLGAPDDPAPED